MHRIKWIGLLCAIFFADFSMERSNVGKVHAEVR